MTAAGHLRARRTRRPRSRPDAHGWRIRSKPRGVRPKGGPSAGPDRSERREPFPAPGPAPRQGGERHDLGRARCTRPPGCGAPSPSIAGRGGPLLPVGRERAPGRAETPGRGSSPSARPPTGDEFQGVGGVPAVLVEVAVPRGAGCPSAIGIGPWPRSSEAVRVTIMPSTARPSTVRAPASSTTSWSSRPRAGEDAPVRGQRPDGPGAGPAGQDPDDAPAAEATVGPAGRQG